MVLRAGMALRATTAGTRDSDDWLAACWAWFDEVVGRPTRDEREDDPEDDDDLAAPTIVLEFELHRVVPPTSARTRRIGPPCRPTLIRDAIGALAAADGSAAA